MEMDGQKQFRFILLDCILHRPNIKKASQFDAYFFLKNRKNRALFQHLLRPSEIPLRVDLKNNNMTCLVEIVNSQTTISTKQVYTLYTVEIDDEQIRHFKSKGAVICQYIHE